MATVNNGSRAAELARQRAAEAARKAAAEAAAKKAAAEAAKKAAAEAAKKAAAAAAKKAAEAAKNQAAQKAKLQATVSKRLGSYTKPLQAPGQGKGTGPLNQAGKAPTKLLNHAGKSAPESAGKGAAKVDKKDPQTVVQRNKDTIADTVNQKIDLRESRVTDTQNKFSTVLKKTLPGKILSTPEKFKGVFTKGKEAIDKAREGDVVGAGQSLKEAKGSFDAGVKGITAATSIVSKIKEAAEGPSVIKKVAEGLKGGGKTLVDDAKTVVKDEFKDAIALAKGGVKKNAKAVAEYATENGAKGIAKKALKSDTAAKAASEGLEKAVKGTARILGKEAAEKVAAKAVTKTAAKVAGKAAGRFVPGVNIAIAAVDTKHAVDVLRDPKASGWKKTMASVTAIGSMAAATNIPVVSQIGAAVSIVGSVAEAVKPESIAKGLKAAGDGINKFFNGLFAAK